MFAATQSAARSDGRRASMVIPAPPTLHPQQRRRARVPAGHRLLLPDRLRRARAACSSCRRAPPSTASIAVRAPARSRARDLGRPARSASSARPSALRRRRRVLRSASSTSSLPDYLENQRRVHYRLGRDRALRRALVRARSTRVRRARARGVDVPERDRRPGRSPARDAPAQERRTSSPPCARGRRITREAHLARDARRATPGATNTRSRPSSCATFRAHGTRAPRVRQHRRLGPQRDHPPLPQQRPAHEGRRSAARSMRAASTATTPRRHAHVPVSGKFTPRAARDLRARARRAARGHRRRAPRHHARADPRRRASRRLVDGLLVLGLLAGRQQSSSSTKGDYKRVLHAPHVATGSAWTCTTSARYSRGGEPRPLEPGLVLTVEPGLYIAERRTTSMPRVPRHRRAHRGRHPGHRGRAATTSPRTSPRSRRPRSTPGATLG